MQNLEVSIPIYLLHHNTMPETELLTYGHIRYLTLDGNFWHVDFVTLETLTGRPRKAVSQAVAWLENRGFLEADRSQKGNLYVRTLEPESHWIATYERRVETIRNRHETKRQNEELRTASKRTEQVRGRS